MSQENVETVRRLYELMTRGDDGLLELVAPDFVVDFSRRLIDPFVTRVDPDAFALFFKEARETWGELPRWEPEELIDGGDNVLAFIRFQTKGRASGVEVDVHVANVWTFRDGKPVELKYFGEDRDAALEAAGLSEQAMSEDENLAVVRRTIESFANDLETWLDTLDPAVEWHPDEEHRTLLRGRDAALRRRERWRETFQEGTYDLEIQELRGNGEHVFSDLREWGRGRGSGIEIEDHDYAHWKVRNGKVVYCCEYGTRNEALEAAGLSE